ncbi:Hsp70 family protein [Nocardia sp. CA-120079]|uniref:Hsp70 family protein n=1 Tax=Nocardia sp. CA-120079 TaxID=3239974 RepID=UPI003D975AB3
MRTTQALGLSIGSVNAVSAAVTNDPAHPVVTTRPTTVTFSGDGIASIGAVAREATVLADFADLAIAQDPIVAVAGRAMSCADLVAAVANRLTATSVHSVLAYPAIYSGDQVAELRSALNQLEATDVGLIPEPIAAAQWLETYSGAAESDLVLVYDLGASCLDLAVVRAGRLVGPPVRSYDFGGRAFDVAVARYGHDITPDAESRWAERVSADDIAGLRTRQVRESVPLVRDYVRAAGVAVSDIDRILLVGGAARPAAVARLLADEFELPIVLGPDPAHTIALGAALLASRAAATDDSPAVVPRGRREPRVAALAAAVLTTGLLVPAAVPFGRTLNHESAMEETSVDVPAAPRFDPHLDPTPVTVAPNTAPALPPNAMLVDNPAASPRLTAPATWWATAPDPAAHDISPLPFAEPPAGSAKHESAPDFPSATIRPDGTAPSATVSGALSNSGRSNGSGRPSDSGRSNGSGRPSNSGGPSNSGRKGSSGRR